MNILNQKKDRPLVSVVMGVYNGEHLLKESVESLITQTYKDLEIIVVNDGSKDHSRDVVMELKTKDQRIVFIDRVENIGLTKSLNEGLSYAHGAYIARLDAGDIAFPSRIEEQVNFLEQHPDVGIVGAGIELFHNQCVIREYLYAPDHEAIQAQLLRFTNPLPHSTLMFRRQVIEQLGGYCNSFVRSQDYDLLLRALDLTRLASLQKVLVRWRFDPSSLSFGSSKQLIYGIAALVRARHRSRGHGDVVREEVWVKLLQTIESFIHRYRLDTKTAAAKYRMLAFVSFSQHRWIDCLYNSIQFLTHNPLFLIHTRTRMNAFIVGRVDELFPCLYSC